MAFADYAARGLAAAYAVHGLAALWTPAAGGASLPCTVILAEPDQLVGFGRGRAQIATHRIEVRSAEIAQPTKGDQVQLVDAGGLPIDGKAFRVTSDPKRDDYGLEWACEATGA